MNKKLIAILLIFSLLTVGLTSVTANETADVADDSVSSDDDALVTGAAPEDTDTDDDATVEDTDDTEEDSDEDAAETDETDDENLTYLSDDNLDEIIDALDSLDDEDLDALLYLLVVSDDDDFEDIIDLLKSDDFDMDDLESLLEELDEDSLDTFLDILDYLLNGDQVPSLAPRLPPKDFFKPANYKLDNVVSSDAGDGSNQYVSSVSKSTSDKFRPYYQEPSELNILDYLIYEYVMGELDFDEFVAALEYYGFDTTGITLNPDGTISWMGITIPAPITSDDVTADDTNSTVEDTSDDDTGADDADADNADAEDATVEDSADADDNAAETDDSSANTESDNDETE